MEIQRMMQIAFGVFLLVNVLVGLWAGRKVKTMRDYVLANQSMGLGVLTISFLAAFITIGHVEFDISFRNGLVAFLPLPFWFFSLAFLFGFILLPRLRFFRGCYTLGDVTRQLYGKKASWLTSFLSVLISLSIVVSQMGLIGFLGGMIGLRREYMVLIIGFAVVYSVWGGIRTITSTGVLHFVLLIMGMLVITHTVLAKIGGIQKLFTYLQKEKELSKILRHKNATNMFVASLFFTTFFTSLLSPPLFQRYQMVQDKRRITQVLLIVAIFYSMFFILRRLTGVSVHLFPNAQEYINRNQIPFIKKLLHNLGVLPQTLGFLMILALGFSTINSHLGALSIVIAHNLFPILLAKKNETNNETQLIWARWAGVFFGIACTLVSACFPVIITRFVFCFTVTLWGGIFIPSVVGIFGLQVHAKSFWANCLAFFITGVIGYFVVFQFKYILSGEPRNNLMLLGLFAMLMGAIAFFVTNYRVCGGFHMVQRGEKKRFSYRKEAEASRLGAWFRWLTSPIIWAQDKVAQYGKEATLAPLFLCISTMIPHVAPTEAMQESMNIWLVMNVIGMLLCAGLLIQDSWPDSWKRYSDVYWFFTMMYCIPFTHVLWFLNDHKDNTIVLMRMAIAIILMIVLVDWYSFLLLSGIGMGVAFFVQYLLKGGDGFSFSFDELWPIGFGLGHVLLAGALFARRREKSTSEQISRAKVLASSLGHELGNTLSGARGYIYYVKAMVEKNTMVDKQGKKRLVLEEEAYSDFVEDLRKGERLMDLMPRQMTMFRQMIQFDGIAEHKLRTVPIDLVLRLACDRFRLIHKDYADVIELVDGDAPFSVRMWDELFFHVIVNLTKNAVVHGGAQKVRVRWNAEEHAVYVQDNGCGISPSAVPRIFDVFYTTSGAGTGVGLSFVRNVMHAFHGEIHLAETGDEGTLFKLTFPKV